MRKFQIIVLSAVLLYMGYDVVDCASLVTDSIMENFWFYIPLGFLIIDIIQIFRWKMKKEFIILPMIFIDWIYLCLLVGIEGFLNKDYDAALGAVILSVAAILVYIIVRAVIKAIKNPKEKKQENISLDYDCSFKKFKAEWLWDEVEEEYKRLVNFNENEKSYEQFIEENSDEIYTFCAGYFAYLFVWLVKNNGIAGDYIEDKNISYEEIRNETENVSDFFYNILDGVVCREDISEKFIGFLDNYYEPANRQECYNSDYNAIVKGNSEFTYCIDFSWEKYREFEKVLNKRYEYYQRDLWVTEYDYDGWFVGTDYSETFRQNFEIRVQPAPVAPDNVQEKYKEYVAKCTEHFKNFPPRLVNEIMEWLTKWNYDVSADTLAEHISQIDITIFMPYGEEIAYSVGFEADFEPEHGISVIVRNYKVLDCGYRGDLDSPWSQESEKKL